MTNLNKRLPHGVLSVDAKIYMGSQVATYDVTVTQFEDLTIIDGRSYQTEDLTISRSKITSKFERDSLWTVML